jgi:HEAT repeat protein
MRRTCHLSLASLGLLASICALAADSDPDERALREAGIGTDGPALVQFFRSRLVSTADRDKIVGLITQLGDDAFDKREMASSQLVAIGSKAEAQLREALKNGPEAEVKQRAEWCLQQIAKGGSGKVAAAAARLVARRKPDGAAEVLLAYLPNAEGEAAAEEVRNALVAVALRDGKADPALVAALEDKTALKRVAAAVALARAGAKEQLPAVRKLLRDPEAAVRLRVALALAGARDKEAVPALIDLLAELPARQGEEAEDVLRALAGEQAPDAALGESEISRRAARDAWAAWWKKNADKVDLAKLAEAPRERGYTLVVMLDQPAKPAKAAAARAGRVVEYDREGKVRWQIEGLQAPRDAQVLPNGNVLVFEYTARRLTERTTKGEVVWDKTAPGNEIVLGAQRLANGNTFLATRTGLVEIDREGKEVASHPVADGLYTARKLRTGEVAYVTMPGKCVRLDAAGKEVASFEVGRVSPTGSMELLPNGHVLLANYTGSKVTEFDEKGKEVWSAEVARPTSVTRLANGHVLVCSLTGQCVIELDRDGKEVWKQPVDGRPYRASRR